MKESSTYLISADEIYREFGVTKDNVRSRYVEHVQNRIVLRQILRDRKLTLREIGEVEGSIDQGLPVHHSSILHSLRIDDDRTIEMKQKYAKQIAKWERQRRVAQDLQDAVQGVSKAFSLMSPTTQDAVLNIRSAMREAGAMPAAGGRVKLEFEQVAGLFGPVHIYSGEFSERLREAKKQYDETGDFDHSLLRQDIVHVDCERRHIDPSSFTTDGISADQRVRDKIEANLSDEDRAEINRELKQVQIFKKRSWIARFFDRLMGGTW